MNLMKKLAIGTGIVGLLIAPKAIAEEDIISNLVSKLKNYEQCNFSERNNSISSRFYGMSAKGITYVVDLNSDTTPQLLLDASEPYSNNSMKMAVNYKNEVDTMTFSGWWNMSVSTHVLNNLINYLDQNVKSPK